ncbi:MAG TPA: EVE domain-containing protein [Pirellulales bacterium]|jgi:predicted RNA-binding protein with PUA-like domain|nr:EVE domain-containing protein [Pirellulales bacterium]
MPDTRRYWLVKSEPDCFSIQDLAASPRQTTFWDGVRNYQARNFMKEMRIGERVLFYHSSTEPPAVVGVAVVVGEAYPDSTAWDPQNMHHDINSSPSNPIWEMVDLRLEEIFPRPLELDSLRTVPALAKMELLRKGSRLSVQPVTEKEFQTISKLAHPAAPSRPAKKTVKAVAKKIVKKPAKKPARKTVSRA